MERFYVLCKSLQYVFVTCGSEMYGTVYKGTEKFARIMNKVGPTASRIHAAHLDLDTI